MADVKASLNQLIDVVYQGQRQANLEMQDLRLQMREQQIQLRELTQTVSQLASFQLEAARRYEIDREEAQQRQQRTDEAIASIQAAVERFDRIIDYLMRQRNSE